MTITEGTTIIYSAAKSASGGYMLESTNEPPPAARNAGRNEETEMTFTAVRIDNVLANATSNYIEGRPDIFDTEFEGELRETLEFALDNNCTGIRIAGERQFVARGWNEMVAVWNAHATDEMTARAAVNAWYELVNAGENW